MADETNASAKNRFAEKLRETGLPSTWLPKKNSEEEKPKAKLTENEIELNLSGVTRQTEQVKHRGS